LVTVVA